MKLYIDGRLATPDDQQRALKQTRDALGVIATLCADMNRVSTLADAGAPALTSRVSARELVAHVQKAQEVEGSEWSGDGGAASIAAQSATDLAHAVAIVAKAAFDEQREAPHAVRAGRRRASLVMLAGTRDAIPALEAGPGAADARQS